MFAMARIPSPRQFPAVERLLRKDRMPNTPCQKEKFLSIG